MEAIDLLNFDIKHLLTILALFVVGYTLYILLLHILMPRKKTPTNRSRMFLSVIFLFSYSLLVALAVFYNGINHEHSQRRKWADKISCQRDIDAEEYFYRKIDLISSDSIALDFAKQIQTDSLQQYLSQKYFSSRWHDYNFFLTCCKEEGSLEITDNKDVSQIVSCEDFFEEKIEHTGSATDNPNLYIMNYGIDHYTYLYTLTLYSSNQYDSNEETDYSPTNVYIEWGGAKITKHSGTLPLYYSYAYYVDSNLWSHSGNYLYDFRIERNISKLKSSSSSNKPNDFFIKDNDYSHYIRHIDERSLLVLSTPLPHPMRILYNFSFYLCIFFFLSILCEFIRSPQELKPHSYAQKLQYTIFSLVFCAFILLGILSFIFIQDLYNREQKENLKEKAFSVLTKMEYLYLYSSDYDNENISTKSLQNQDTNSSTVNIKTNTKKTAKALEIQDKIQDISGILSIDIHIFDKNGNFVFSACEEHSQETDLNKKKIFSILKEQGSHIIIQQEENESGCFWIAYMPFRDVNNEIIGYIMLPSYISQSAWKIEISRYLSAYLNLFVLLGLLTLIISYFLSNYVTRPLKLLSKSVNDIKLTEKNQLLLWSSNDEIGDLVKHYNSMVTKLEENVQKLAESERRGVWNQIAKQVAHEIKNPLTPLQLQVQQLERAYKDNKADFEQRLKNFSSLLCTQIDVLSNLADTFSKLSQWQQPRLQNLNVSEVLEPVINLFSGKENIQILMDFKHNKPDDLNLFADPHFIKQTLTNLLKNAVESLEESNIANPTITIIADIDKEYFLLSVKDNGQGIESQKISRIFEPHFTTRSSGSGLGLAISREMIESMKGSLTVKNLQEGGACFTISIPSCSVL